MKHISLYMEPRAFSGRCPILPCTLAHESRGQPLITTSNEQVSQFKRKHHIHCFMLHLHLARFKLRSSHHLNDSSISPSAPHRQPTASRSTAQPCRPERARPEFRRQTGMAPECLKKGDVMRDLQGFVYVCWCLILWYLCSVYCFTMSC